MPTKKQLEAIIEGLGFDSSTPLEDYVKIGSFIYPKTSAVTLKWEGGYGEFKRDDSWYFDENGDEMRERLEAWGLTYDPEYLGEFVEYGGTHWEDTRTGIQAKISQSWDSLDALMSECDPDDIGLADRMMLTLPMGTVAITDLTFERSWTVDKTERQARLLSLRLGEELAEVLTCLTLTSTKKVGSKGIKELIAQVPDGVSIEDAECVLSSVEVTSSAQTQWDAHVASIEAEIEVERQKVEAERQKVEAEERAERDRLFEGSLREFGSGSGKYAMMLIPKGDFMMGALEDDEDAYDDEKPRHQVTLTKDFLMGKYAVTQSLWESVMGSNPSRFKGANRPVECVSWFDTVKFCNKISELEGLEPAYIINGGDVTCNWTAKGYRLPTEAEWEYSARGGEYHKYSGSENVDEVAWYDDNSGSETHPVGQKKPNGFGLYDMSGNVWEWVWDCWPETGDYSTETSISISVENQLDSTEINLDSVENPTGNPTGSDRVRRGGCWDDIPEGVRSSYRDVNDPADQDALLGFRICRFP